MHTSIVIVHVTSMILSMGLMVGAIGLGLFGKAIAAKMATIGFAASILGFISGGVLLFGSVLSIECALLTSYLIGVTVLYHLGFAFGDAKNARLIRDTSL